MLLAGDLGATKTLLGLFTPGADRPEPLARREFETLAFSDLGDMVGAFLEGGRRRGTRIDAACFGVAGPVIGESALLTNVPWRADATAIRDRFSIARVALLNDLEAMAHAVPALHDSELEPLQLGQMSPGGNKALIAAGTGLGEAFLHRVGGGLVPSATEAGHADFAARTPADVRLLEALTLTFGRVSVEHVVSGRGLLNIHRVMHAAGGCLAGDPEADPSKGPAMISTAALARRCPRCVETLDLFVAAYGAEAGNLALRTMATGGVYVGGGIAPKILPALKAGAFVDAFVSKSPFDSFMRGVPLFVILNPAAALLGAAVRASALLTERSTGPAR